MTDLYDKALLLRFAEWMRAQGFEDRGESIARNIDSFLGLDLAARQPPGEPCDDASIAAARAWVVGDDGVETFSVLIQDTLERALDALAREPGLAATPDGPLVTLMVPTRVRLTPPPAPQRFCPECRRKFQDDHDFATHQCEPLAKVKP